MADQPAVPVRQLQDRRDLLHPAVSGHDREDQRIVLHRPCKHDRCPATAAPGNSHDGIHGAPVVSLLRIVGIQHPLAVNHEFVGMRPRRQADEQLMNSVACRHHRMGLRIPPVELPGHGDFLDALAARAIGELVTVGRLHPDDQHALALQLFRVIRAADPRSGVLFPKLPPGTPSPDNLQGNLQQPLGALVHLHGQHGGRRVHLRRPRAGRCIRHNHPAATGRACEIKTVQVEDQPIARRHRLHGNPTEEIRGSLGAFIGLRPEGARDEQRHGRGGKKRTEQGGGGMGFHGRINRGFSVKRGAPGPGSSIHSRPPSAVEVL